MAEELLVIRGNRSKSFPAALYLRSIRNLHLDASMTKILPTVGRIVLFTPSRLTGDGRFAHIDGGKPLAAIVAHVFNDGLVNLAVFDSNGQPHSRTSVPLVQEGEPKPEHGYSASGCPTRSGRRQSTLP
jgi:hypothetical protein